MPVFTLDVTESGIDEYDGKRDPGMLLGVSYRTVRKVRNVLTGNGRYCLVYNAGEGYYTFPGGSLEPGEPPYEAALRETREEVGAAVIELQAFGEVREFREQTGVLQITTFFTSRLESLHEPQLTEEERLLGTSTIWASAQKAAQLLESQESLLYHRRFSKTRDAVMFRRLLQTRRESA